MNLLTILFSILLISILLLFFILNSLPKASVATAGTFDNKKTNYNVSMNPFITIGIDKYLSKHHRYVLADGICLVPKNINNKDFLAVNIYEPINLNPKKGDVLLINIFNNGEEVLKLREFHSYNDNNELIVFRYLDNGEPNKTSIHKPKNVLGKVILVHKGNGNWMNINC